MATQHTKTLGAVLLSMKWVQPSTTDRSQRGPGPTPDAGGATSSTVPGTGCALSALLGAPGGEQAVSPGAGQVGQGDVEEPGVQPAPVASARVLGRQRVLHGVGDEGELGVGCGD